MQNGGEVVDDGALREEGGVIVVSTFLPIFVGGERDEGGGKCEEWRGDACFGE